MPLIVEVSVLEHPFHVLVGFLLVGVAVKVFGSFDEEIRDFLLPFFGVQAGH